MHREQYGEYAHWWSGVKGLSARGVILTKYHCIQILTIPNIIQQAEDDDGQIYQPKS